MIRSYKEGGLYMSEDGFLDRQIDAVVYNQEDNLKIMEMNTFASIFTQELEPWDCRDVCC